MTGKLLELVSEDPIEFAKCLGAGKMGSGKGSSSGVKVETPKKLLCCLFEVNGIVFSFNECTHKALVCVFT